MTRPALNPLACAAFALAVNLSQTPLEAQAGDARDRPGVEQKEIWKEMDVPPAPVLSPREAMESFRIAEGYSLELVAAEPLVNDPVAIAWDEQGRLWVAEMWAYMPDPDGTGEDQPVSRVVVLEDLDGDGRMDKTTVFRDQLVMPRALAIVEGGVLVADPPNLLFCEDLNGDLRSDRETVVGEYAATGNVEHAENGLMRGLDNWLYNAKSKRRLKFEDGQATFEETRFRGQWGITMDDWGRLYYNTNSFYLYGDMVPSEYVSRHPGWTPQAGLGTEVAPDRSVFTARINPGINRAYIDGWLRPDHRMKRIDAASDPEIYRGHRGPESLRGNAFIPDPAAHVVSRFTLRDEGMNVVAEKRLQEDEEWGQIEFIASTDERFRPVATTMGPDGFLYIVDMYRGIIQHKTFLTTFLRKQIIERGLDEPVGHGRIYRLVHHSDSPSRDTPNLGGLAPRELVNRLESETGWERDTAQRLLAQSRTQDPSTLDALRQTAATASPRARIHALWTLEALDAIDEATALAAMQSGHEWVATHALRVASPLLDSARANSSPLFDAYLQALVSDSPRLRLQALHLLPELSSDTFLLDTIASLTAEDLADPYVMDASVSALYGHELAFLDRLSNRARVKAASPLLSNLAYAAFKERDAAKATGLLRAGLDRGRKGPALQAVVSGLSRAAAERNARPLSSPSEPTVIAQLAKKDRAAVERVFTWPEKSDPNAEAEVTYTTADKASIERGRPIYENLCAICHQSDGQGAPSLAPPLAGTEWVTGPKDRLALIVAHGLSGPIQVNGQDWNSAMPPHGMHPALEGEKLNDVLNYIRAAWNNNSEPYEPGEARALLQPYSERILPWTAKELEAALD